MATRLFVVVQILTTLPGTHAAGNIRSGLMYMQASRSKAQRLASFSSAIFPFPRVPVGYKRLPVRVPVAGQPAAVTGF